ncbi:MAG: STAS domain-containing protein [Planctomycetota bacterium]|jgi:anti-anti-sigma factor
MEIQERTRGAVTVVGPRGPLILDDADRFRLRVLEVMTRTLGRLVVDVAGVAFVDSRGLEALVDAAGELATGGRQLKLCGLNDTVREVLELTELASRFDIYEDEGTAVRSFL